MSIAIEPIGNYVNMEKRAVFTEDNLPVYMDLLKKPDSYVFARYYNVSDEEAVREKLFSLQEEKQKDVETLSRHW